MDHVTWTKSDFRVDWFSGQGAGGQHRNKHQNCCRITHKQSGLSATGQRSRSRTENQREAFLTLSQRLIEHYGLNGSAAARVEQNNVVRTYHFERNTATDGAVSLPVDQVMNGRIDDFVIRALTEGRSNRKTGRQ